LKVKIKFFSSCYDIIGIKEMMLKIPKNTLLIHLFEKIIQLYPKLNPLKESILLAINKEFADSNIILYEGDEIAIMPPIGGG